MSLATVATATVATATATTAFTTAAAAATTAAVAAAAAARRTLFTGTGFVDRQGTALEILLMERVNRRIGVRLGTHLDERETPGTTGGAILHDVDCDDSASGGEMIPFYLQDDCGVILVQPEGAELEVLTTFNETCTRLNPLYYGKGPLSGIMDSTGRRRFHEQALPLHTPVYVIGQARERQDAVAAEIAADPTAPMFLISTKSEEQIRSGFAWAYWGWLLFGTLLLVGSLLWRDGVQGRDPGREWPWYALAVLGYYFAVTAGWVWMVFNGLIDLRQRVRQAWAQVDVQLKRRHDLIPRLVATVSGLKEHEARLQTQVAALRAQQSATPPGVEGPDYASCTSVIIAVQEAYPELTAQPAFLSLQQSLVDTEQRIALARGYFNEIATSYNTRLEQIPDRFIAGLARLQPQPLMLAGDFERAPVTVNFAA